MTCSNPNVDQREAQYARLVFNVLNALNDAVRKRQNEGQTRAALAAKIGCNRSQLSRVLNGNIPNLTIKTISDILWAARYEPVDFTVDPYEEISSNYTYDVPIKETTPEVLVPVSDYRQATFHPRGSATAIKVMSRELSEAS